MARLKYTSARKELGRSQEKQPKSTKSAPPDKALQTAPDRSFGTLLRLLRGAGGFTQVGLARRAQMPVTVLAALERKPGLPDNESTVYDLARGLGLDPHFFAALIDAYVGVRK